MTIRTIPLFLFLCTLAWTAAFASSRTTEITDMWWNPAESGWGVNIVLQNDVAFMTFFIYDAAHNPVWYSSDVHYQGGGVWSGALYATNGPWYGSNFAATSVSARTVGTVSFALNGMNSATLTYSADGTHVVKTLQRETWTKEDFSGSYLGAILNRATNCTISQLNGITERGVVLSIAQRDDSVSISMATTDAGNCVFSGTYSQTGKLGQVSGTYSCDTGAVGTFTLFELTRTVSGITGRTIGQNQYCNWSGYVAGSARVN